MNVKETRATLARRGELVIKRLEKIMAQYDSRYYQNRAFNRVLCVNVKLHNLPLIRIDGTFYKEVEKAGFELTQYEAEEIYASLCAPALNDLLFTAFIDWGRDSLVEFLAGDWAQPHELNLLNSLKPYQHAYSNDDRSVVGFYGRSGGWFGIANEARINDDAQEAGEWVAKLRDENEYLDSWQLDDARQLFLDLARVAKALRFVFDTVPDQIREEAPNSWRVLWVDEIESRVAEACGAPVLVDA